MYYKLYCLKYAFKSGWCLYFCCIIQLLLFIVKLALIYIEKRSISLSYSQLVQQQALMTQSAYLSPVATAMHMQQMAALNANGIIATPITPMSSGNKPP